ncbi:MULTISPECIES: ParA family protein [Vibrio]|uniref:ParA family protein n=1 Tax=Vibrio TaxID=662 RepID=UPI000C85FEFE|nr:MULTISPECIES: ParA family protein [Vibrio]PMJ43149.1 cobyrinic acid ac-diamide synthase [Vibrio cyclitrophicus]TKE80064.1 ParA family protein [Vibrio sp. F12]
MSSKNPLILGVFQQKGGVGKTAVSSIVAEYASIKTHMNVLVVDLDMQCNSSDYWVGMESSSQSTGGQLPPIHPDWSADDPDCEDIEERSTIADTFYGKEVLPYETFVNPKNGFTGKVDCLLGHPALLEKINTEFSNESGQIEKKVINRLKEVLFNEYVGEDYDLVVLDTGPSRNPVFRSAIRCATHAVIPFEPEEKSMQGINAMIQVIQSDNFARDDENQLNLVGLVPNKVKINTKLHKGTLDMLHESLGSIMLPDDIYLPYSIAYPERDLKGISPKSIFQISKHHTALKHSESLCKHILCEIFGSVEINNRLKQQ